MKKIKKIKYNEDKINKLLKTTLVALTITSSIVVYNVGKDLLEDSNLRIIETSNGYALETDYDTDEFIKDFNDIIEDNETDPSLQEAINNYDIPYEELIKEYGDYLDKEYLIKAIKTLKVELVDNNDEYIKENNTDTKKVQAYYSNKNNVIKLNIDELSLNDKENTSKVISHEFFHFLLRKDHMYLSLFNSFYTYDNLTELCEGFTELLTKESFYSEEKFQSISSYPLNVTYARILSEFISKEAGIELGCFSSKKAIKELSKYDTEENIKKLLEDINQDCLNYYDYSTDNELKRKIIKSISSLYQKKYNEEVIENDDLTDLISNIYMESYMLDFDKNYYINPEEDKTKIYVY